MRALAVDKDGGGREVAMDGSNSPLLVSVSSRWGLSMDYTRIRYLSLDKYFNTLYLWEDNFFLYPRYFLN